MDGDPDLNFLLVGGMLTKVRSRSWQKKRIYRLQEDCKTVWHQSQKVFKRKQTCGYRSASRLRFAVLPVELADLFAAKRSLHAAIFPRAVSVDDIDSVRNGRQSEGLNKHTDPGDDERCFSIVFKGRKKVLDLMASDRDEADQWVKSFEKVLNNLRNLSRQQTSEQYP